MKKGYVHISILLDKSGSIELIKNDIMGSVNNFIETQMLIPGDLTISLSTFSAKIQAIKTFTGTFPIDDFDYQRILFFDKPEKFNKLTHFNFQPSGGTALFDNCKRMIDETGTFLANLPIENRPEKVLFVIITDGEENSSYLVSKEQLDESINLQKNVYNWQFIYLGANQDAFAVGKDLGIKAMNYSTTERGIKSMISVLNSSTKNYRTEACMDFMINQNDIEL